MVLPASQRKHEFIHLLRSHRVLIVCGGTGCGKSTQLPLAAQQAFSGKVVCTQPRRAATTTVAARVADEHGSPVGQHVGYGVRFDNKYTQSTKVLFVTEGHLLQTLVPKPKEGSGAIEMNRFDGILFLDECHEDSKELEILLFLAREALGSRPEFKVVLMSATPDVSALTSYFGNMSLNVMTIPGVAHPVVIDHLEDDTQIQRVGVEMELVCLIMERHHDAAQDGDFLVFMPGETEIKNLITKITNEQKQQPHATRPLRVLPFHASQARADQDLVFEPFPEGRKVIVATNIAESSLTIGNLKVVFDGCAQKVKYFDFELNAFELRTERACKNALVQRAGRVGRTSPGRAIRMCTKAEFDDQPEFNDAAVTRTPIDDVLLKLLVCTPSNAFARNLLSTDRFMHPPSPAAQQHALKLLVDLGAITCSNPVGEPLQLSQATVTPKGRKMSLMPLPTELAYMLLTVPVLHARLPMLKAAAMLSIAGPAFVMPRHDPEDPGLVKRAQASIRRFKSGPSDHLTLVNVLHEYQQQEGDKKARDDWCERNFVNAHSLHEADLIFEQLFASLQKHDKKRWLFDNIKSFKSNNVPNDLSIALLEAYTANLAVRCRAATTAQQDALDRLEEGCQNVPDNVYWVVWSGQKITLPHNSAAHPTKDHGMVSSSKSAADTQPFVVFSEANKKSGELVMFNCSPVNAKHINKSKRFIMTLQKYGTNVNPVVRERLIQERIVSPA